MLGGKGREGKSWRGQRLQTGESRGQGSSETTKTCGSSLHALPHEGPLTLGRTRNLSQFEQREIINFMKRKRVYRVVHWKGS